MVTQCPLASYVLFEKLFAFGVYRLGPSCMADSVPYLGVGLVSSSIKRSMGGKAPTESPFLLHMEEDTKAK